MYNVDLVDSVAGPLVSITIKLTPLLNHHFGFGPSVWFFSHLEDDEGDHFGEHNCFVLTPSPVDDFFGNCGEFDFLWGKE